MHDTSPVPEIQYSLFESVTARTISTHRITWRELCDLLRNPPQYASKERCPLIKLATFHSERLTDEMRRAGCRSARNNANVAAVYGVEGDYDGGEMGIDEAARLLDDAGIAAVLYTTPSHTDAAPRWRVLAPFSRARSPSYRSACLMRLNNLLGGVFDAKSFTLSQCFYFGRVPGVPYQCHVVEGDPIDLAEEIPTDATYALDETVVKESHKGMLDFLWTPKVEEEVREALQHIPADDRRLWIKITEALSCYGDAARDAWLDWSATSGKWDPENDPQVWDTMQPRKVTPATLFHFARKHGWRKEADPPPPAPKEPEPEPVKRTAIPDAALLSEKGAWLKVNSNLIHFIHAHQREYFPLHYDTLFGHILSGDRLLEPEDINNIATASEQTTRLKWTPIEVEHALEVIARESPVNHLLDFLSSKAWDGTPRLDTFFTRYFGLDDTRYHRACARVLFLSAHNRLLDPGCQADQTVVLVGPEGIGKTTGIGRVFFDDERPFGRHFSWVKRGLPRITDNNCIMQLREAWVVELPEFVVNTQVSKDTLKAFLTNTHETYRVPYASRVSNFDRHNIFYANTNYLGQFDDGDLNRRFLPVFCDKQIDLKGIMLDRDQLQAEACFRAQLLGELHPYLERKEYEELEANLTRMEIPDAYFETIGEYLEGKDETSLMDLMTKCLFLPVSRRGHREDIGRIAAVMGRLGWVQHSEQREGHIRVTWRRPGVGSL